MGRTVSYPAVSRGDITRFQCPVCSSISWPITYLGAGYRCLHDLPARCRPPATQTLNPYGWSYVAFIPGSELQLTECLVGAGLCKMVMLRSGSLGPNISVHESTGRNAMGLII